MLYIYGFKTPQVIPRFYFPDLGQKIAGNPAASRFFAQKIRWFPVDPQVPPTIEV